MILDAKGDLGEAGVVGIICENAGYPIITFLSPVVICFINEAEMICEGYHLNLWWILV